ncbi:hypothetical protein C772_00761 [Bhargavaea cecembensis DSE10]|uniref:DUF1328 domain-containing protein n=1 Tax=Bhargavaea cecembensis DSE10 TaxID=1235279 RepID=M7NIZ3_9BACL|nr:hypothetical protein [Bhargavaea cecembensis]EMR07116.1 hypothetical protein C772_00761 [Bhargavaea cecembensis DSE10]
MRWAIVFLFILIGSFIFVLKIDGIGIAGTLLKILLGIGCFYIAALFIPGKKEKQKNS